MKLWLILSLEQGANLDFTANQQVILIGPNPVDVPVVLQVDQHALEQNEQFQLQLQTDDDQMSLQSNEFLLDTITITIVDNDSKYRIMLVRKHVCDLALAYPVHLLGCS